MVYDVIMSICMNISLLIVLALMLTKIEFVKVLLLNGEEEERNDRKTGTRKVRNQLVLGGIFGIFCVISDYIGGIAICVGIVLLQKTMAKKHGTIVT